MKTPQTDKKSAPILFQMMIYAVILFVAQLISQTLPPAFPIPTPVIGLVLLYLLLTCRIIKIEWVDSLANTLIGLIAFLFVPSGISLTANLKIMQTEGLKLIFVIILSTIILLVVTAYTARALLWLKSKLQAPTKPVKPVTWKQQNGGLQ